MFVVRSIVLLILILGMVFAYSPGMREEMSQSWESARPGVLELMDSVYMVLRDFVDGANPHDGIQDHAPGVDFNIITTMERSSLF
jgi:hypothetical protein